MAFDLNKYASIAALSLLIVLILFTNLRHCFANPSPTPSKVRQYEGDGCTKLQYMSINSDDHCPGEGRYAIAGQCLEYLECVKSTVNASLLILDYFQICEDSQYFNGTGCSPMAGERKGDCTQKHCKIVDVDLDDGSEQVVTEAGGAESGADPPEGYTTVNTLVDEAVEANTERLNSSSSTTSTVKPQNSTSTSSYCQYCSRSNLLPTFVAVTSFLFSTVLFKL